MVSLVSFGTYARVLQLIELLETPPKQGPPRGAAPDQIVALQGQLGFPLPAELRRWLETCNGYTVGPWGFYGANAGNNHKKHLDIGDVVDLHPDWRSSRWIPVASDGCGSTYVLDASGAHGCRDAVYFVDCFSPSELDYAVASSLPRFLTFYLESDLPERPRSWPFDREYVLARDPELASIDAELLPWNKD
jgi:hypothetical protein